MTLPSQSRPTPFSSAAEELDYYAEAGIFANKKHITYCEKYGLFQCKLDFLAGSKKSYTGIGKTIPAAIEIASFEAIKELVDVHWTNTTVINNNSTLPSTPHIRLDPMHSKIILDALLSHGMIEMILHEDENFVNGVYLDPNYRINGKAAYRVKLVVNVYGIRKQCEAIRQDADTAFVDAYYDGAVFALGLLCLDPDQVIYKYNMANAALAVAKLEKNVQ